MLKFLKKKLKGSSGGASSSAAGNAPPPSDMFKFLERFVMAEDRSTLLASLTPESDDWFYYHLLHVQTERDGETEDEWFARLTKQRRGHAKYAQLELRHHLLQYERASAAEKEATREKLRMTLGLRFNHAREQQQGVAAEVRHPSALRDEVADAKQLLGGKKPHEFTAAASEFLAERMLKEDKTVLNQYLSNLKHPNVSHLVKLVARQLKENKTRFGSFEVHNAMTLAQLQKLASKVSGLSTERSFVLACLNKMPPPSDFDELPFADKLAYFDRVLAFLESLPSSLNALRVTVLFHRLKLGRDNGVYDQNTFREYLRIPRSVTYRPRNKPRPSEEARLNESFGVFSAPNDDSSLVFEYVSEYFRQAENDDMDVFSDFIDENRLARLYAEAKLTSPEATNAASASDLDEWRESLGVRHVQTLSERTDLKFSLSNPEHFDVTQSVSLDVVTKNIGTLSVKVFEVNTRNYYRTKMSEIEPSLSLDGLTAQEEFTVQATQDGSNPPPLLSLRRQIDVPSLDNRRGVFIIDVLGNGMNARALVRKGSIRFVERRTLQGHVFRLYDEAGTFISEPGRASVVLGSQTFESNAKGEIVVPYRATQSSGSQTQNILLYDGELTALGRFEHYGERYDFSAGLHLDRETVLQKCQAEIVVRPSLTLSGLPVPPTLLQDVAIKIDTVDVAGTQSSKTERRDDLKLEASAEFVHSFPVPDNVRSIAVSVTARVKRKTDGALTDVSASRSWSVSSGNDNDRIGMLHLRWGEDGYTLLVLGKAGEPRAFQTVRIALRHQYLQSEISGVYQTNEAGQVLLGPLPRFTHLQAELQTLDAIQRSWPLQQERFVQLQDVVQTYEGADVRIPYTGAADHVEPEVFSLMRIEPNNPRRFVSDHLRALSIAQSEGGAYLEIAGNLEAGMYILCDKHDHWELRVVVHKGTLVMNGRFVLGHRILAELPDSTRPPLQARSEVRDGALSVRVSHVNSETRVHIVATHFEPDFDVRSALLSQMPTLQHSVMTRKQPSVYLSQRSISDEHRYIIDRRSAQKYVGNMLNRPSLLLHPRVRRETSFEKEPELAGASGFEASNRQEMAYGVADEMLMDAPMSMMRAAAPVRSMRSSAKMKKSESRSRASRRRQAPSSVTIQPGAAGLDFLAKPSARLLNVRPDADGHVTVPLESLGAARHSQVTVVVADRFNTVVQRVPIGAVVRNAQAASAAAAASKGKQEADEDDGSEEYTGPTDITLASPTAFIDTRLIKPLDGNVHFTEKYLIDCLLPGQSTSIGDFRGATMATYTSLRDVFTLFSTVIPTHGANGDALRKFDFAASWNSLSEQKQLAKYSEFASHELNVFLYRRDRAFFDRVVRPHLAHKLPQHRSIIDRYFLDDDLSEFLRPDRFDKLNAFEKILLLDRTRGKASPEAIAAAIRAMAEVENEDMEAYTTRFKTALQTKSMVEAEEEQAEKERAPPRPKQRSAPKPAGGPPPPPMGGGGGGMAFGRASVLSASLSASGLMEDDDSDGEDDFDDWAMEESRAEPQRQLYRAPPTTKEYEETGYFQRSADEQPTYLVPQSRFWADFADHVVAHGFDNAVDSAPFLSRHFIHASGSFTEVMFAAAVLDFSFDTAETERDDDGYTLTVTARDPVVVFRKQVQETPVMPSSIAVTQNYFDPADPFIETSEGDMDKYIVAGANGGEFLCSKMYTCRVVLTNASSTSRKVEVLLQIPQGAVALSGPDGGPSFRTTTLFRFIDSYSTELIEYSFYFPAPGIYTHYPVHVSKGNEVVGFGAETQLRVLRKSVAPPDLSSWRYVSQKGTDAEVVDFLRIHNLNKIYVVDMAWRLVPKTKQAKQLLREVTDVLRERRHFMAEIWAYAVHHGVDELLPELLPHYERIGQLVGPYFVSDLVSYDAWEQRVFQHLEYAPLINNRVHQLRTRGSGGSKARELIILNREFQGQYRAFLEYMAHRTTSLVQFSDVHLLMVAYYLLLQDRIDDAMGVFARVQNGDNTPQVAYDYMRAYLDFYSPEGPTVAGEIAAKYLEYPVLRTRRLFADVHAQVREIAGDDVEDGGEDGNKGGRDEAREHQKQMGKMADTDPSLEFEIDGESVVIHHENLTECTVNFYVMDIELLFSTTPFIGTSGGSDADNKFLFVTPNFSVDVELVARQGVERVPLPEEVRNANVYVEVVANAGLSRSQAHYAHSLVVKVIENYGQLRVASKVTGRPVRRAYIKVYSRNNDGSTEFYKDGYTDLRGKFDYASLSIGKLDKVREFSILVLTDEQGAVVRQAGPPPS